MCQSPMTRTHRGIRPRLLTLVRLLDLIKFFLPILPEVELPDEKISFDERIIFTVGSGIIFLFGQLPLFGLVSGAEYKVVDPFFSVRSIFAMEKASLLELGLLPLITAGFLWQLAAGLKLIKVNFNLRQDRELFQSGQKLTALFLSIVYSAGLIYSGYYDNVIQKYDPLNGDSAPLGTYVLLFLQINAWSFILTLLVDVFDKGYAFGSGILCFLTLQTATTLVRDLVGLEVTPLLNSNRVESYGALINLVRNFSIFNLSQLNSSIVNAFTRLQLPNLNQFYISLLTILAIIGLQNYRIELPIRSTKVRGMNNVYPIRLLYTGALPVLFAYTVIVNFQIFGFFLVTILNKFGIAPVLIDSLLGKFNAEITTNNLVLKSGILYYFSNSTSLLQSLLSPIKTVVYSVSVVLLSVWFANKWSYISGSSPRDISKQFKEQGISITGKRDISITKELSRVIPVAAVSGGFALAVLAVGGEFLGGLGKGISTIIGVSSAFGILEEFMIEYQQTGGNSQFSSAFGGQ
ncbi:SecY protein [Suhomyces tanzawaensis NRRL Y-17324]|uniref:SecY protein n=1 Tax=Suhomyces tanzawaensis NRRL Y-17324 TaxID=984487 RepID=A0A1E4SPL5_9ASCO|nr:SecY protein [Suhomyces tanzawaensis NRRL Y-17324]ODV81428.1 SecY protein [Suhomyces tanzawaensis NRRL Y-17324]